ncbi:diphosphomevalonate decarboxylase [Episyrphus balteatus]|uniref:diphosphomevalonate decarboxylase n=1 Tax=Episyrphus balteatus TaxID=286459 RepID=UPI0024859A47|nr:diphosphomevalonate decarboxylase [Episyrphus balteatus]
MFIETCIAPVNIALIKYWGKRDEDLILPINDSLSMTLSTDEMCAKTTAAASDKFDKNTMWLNGEEVPFEENPRVMRCVRELKRLASLKKDPKFPIEWNLRICSKNNFPTAAGLASSAAGYACLVYTLACLYGVEDEELTSIARQGSGSACRSLYGGFVQWIMGTHDDGTDSIAVPIAPESHWPNMHVLILVVNDSKKKTASTKGMQRSVMTSDLIKHRAANCVPKRISEITDAIQTKDFNKFAEITMKDSNQFHAIALDTFPPCIYMNDVSHAISDFVHALNEAAGATKVAYTFDAGPNACLYLLKEDVPQVFRAIQSSFPSDSQGDEYLKGLPIKEEADSLLKNSTPYGENLLKYVIHTKVGTGPKMLSKEDSLIGSDGLPL